MYQLILTSLKNLCHYSHINLFYFPKDTVNLGILTFAPSDSMYVDYFDKYALTLRCVKKNEQ